MKAFKIAAAFCVLFFLSSTCKAQVEINAQQAAQHIGDSVRVCDIILEGKYLYEAKDEPAQLYMGSRQLNFGTPFIAAFDLDSGNQEFLNSLNANKSQVNDFTELADTGGTVWAKFGVTRQPAFAFISSDGSIDVVQSGLSEPDLTRRVMALSEH